LPVYVQAKNPFVIGNVNDSHEQLFKHFDSEGKLNDDEVIQRLIDSGYDSVYAKESGELNILDPKKIKSAIGNRGTYDIDDPDITKAAGGEVNKERAASIGGEEFYNAALAAGLPLDNDTLNKIVDLVNAGHSVSKAAQLVKGGREVHMMGGGRPPKKTTLKEDLKSFKDPAMALADLLAGALRGTTTAATGFAGDMEELYRQYGKGAISNAVRQLLPKREGKATTFPTIEEMNAMLPPVVPAGAGRSTQVADVGQFFGENNPLAPTALAAVKPVAKAVKAAAPYVARGALDLAKSEPARRAVNQVMRATGAGPMELMAYQGSPHLYAPTPKNPLGELDPTKIGSGEGAQAYGMGHYLAENRNVGEGYRNSISSQHGQDVTINGVPVDEYYMTVYGNADQLPMEEARQQYDKAALIEMLSFNRSPNDILSYAEDMGYAPSVIDWFKTDVMPKTKMPGYLYTHDLSDEAIARMLDWDKPLSEQSQHVKDALSKSDYAFRDMAYDLTGDPDPTGGHISRTGMNPKEFAEHMRSLGVPGVKYLDQESKARQAMDPEFTGGTRNFVLFPGEEDASKIIRREKTGGAVMMGAGGTVKKGIELVDTFLNALKEGEKAAVVRKGPPKDQALPLNLARANPKTTAELREIAERVGRQINNEHVTSPLSGTNNLAGRSKKESERLQKLNYVLKKDPAIKQPNIYNPKLGDVLIANPGDQTVSDSVLKSIEELGLGDVPIDSPQQGGSRFSLGTIARDPKGQRGWWASGPNPSQSIQDKGVRLLEQLDLPGRVVASHLAMGPISNNYALHQADANLRAAALQGISDESANYFDDLMRRGTKVKGQDMTFLDWPGIKNTQAAYDAMRENPEMRKWFVNRMKVPSITEPLGFPSGLDVQWATTEPDLRNLEVNMTGHTMGELDPYAPLLNEDWHNTYEKRIPLGGRVGKQKALTPFSLAFPDATQHIMSTQRPQDFTGTIQKVFPHQVVDDQWINEVNEYARMLKKITGKKKGGKVNADDNSLTIDEFLKKQGH
jgi:hypothetical protein